MLLLLRTRQDVADHVYVSGHGAPNTAGEAYDSTAPISNGADTMQRALHACPIVTPKLTYSQLRCLQVLPRDLRASTASSDAC